MRQRRRGRRRQSPNIILIIIVMLVIIFDGFMMNRFLITNGIIGRPGNFETEDHFGQDADTQEKIAQSDTVDQDSGDPDEQASAVDKGDSDDDNEEPDTDSAQNASVSEVGSYYYSILPSDQQQIYNEILAGVQNRETDIPISNADGNVTGRVYNAILLDHPECFWMYNGNAVTTSYSDRQNGEFDPGYGYTETEIAQIQAAVDEAREEVFQLLPDGADDYEKTKIIYEYVINHTEYIASKDDQSIVGSLWKKQAVCAGYARAVQYFLNEAGIPNIYVTGVIRDDNDGHAWNVVLLDGEYYYIDATWGDQPGFFAGTASDATDQNPIMYDYLCPFPDEYEQRVAASTEFTLPSCTATDRNFYVMNGACFDHYDKQEILDFCKMRIDNGSLIIRFKFRNQNDYAQAKGDWDSACDEFWEAVDYYYNQIGESYTQGFSVGCLDELKTIYMII